VLIRVKNVFACFAHAIKIIELEMIIVQLRGGLGNQLFEYAFARALAKHHSVDLWIDKSFYHPKYLRPRQFELFNYNIHCQKVLEYEECFDAKYIMEIYDISKCVVDTGFRQEDIIPLGSQIVMQGWWSSKNNYLFEEDFRSLLLKELVHKETIESYDFRGDKDRIQQSRNPVFVHVRRGDYKENQHIFHLVGEDYYERAFDFIESQVSDPEFFIFSDEIEYVQSNMKFRGKVTFVKTLAATESLELARTCKHFISANSTFSWWSAYLSEMSKKIVLFPKKYYTNEKFQTSYETDADYLSPFWMKM
jgi:Glycosyl transferase family 11